MGPDRESITSTPRWVKVFGIIAAVLVLLFVIMVLAGHGPGRHMFGGLGGQTPPSIVTLSSFTEAGGVGGLKPLVVGHTP